jgi:hypothetical protein
VPGKILLANDPQLPFGFAVPLGIAGVGSPRRIGAIAGREGIEELGELRLKRPADRGHAERSERHQIAVEFAHPVDQPVAPRVADQDVAARASKRAVFIEGCVSGDSLSTPGDAGRVGVVIIVGIDSTAETIKVVAAGAADEPVVPQVTEQHIVPVVPRFGWFSASGRSVWKSCLPG